MLPSVARRRNRWLRFAPWRDAKDDFNAIATDLDSAHHDADELAFARPVEPIEATADLGRKLLQATDHEGQFAFCIGGIERGLSLFLKLRHTLPLASNSRLKLNLFDQACGVAVDEAIDAATERSHLAIEASDLLWCRSFAGLADAPAVFVRYAAWIFQ